MRCTTITTKGRRCLLPAVLSAEQGEGEARCRYHIGGEITAAVHELNRQRTRRYWQRVRAERAATAAPIDTNTNDNTQEGHHNA
jgi:hypothetical protein